MDCPNCGNRLNETQETCDKCGFDFNDTLSCPYRVSNRCIFNQDQCKVNGLDYEDCKVYLHKAGLTT